MGLETSSRFSVSAQTTRRAVRSLASMSAGTRAASAPIKISKLTVHLQVPERDNRGSSRHQEHGGPD